MGREISRSEDKWRSLLDDEAYRVMRESATEAPFSGTFNAFYNEGNYRCKGCGSLLFSSDSKFDSGCGWPSFDKAAIKENILEHVDRSYGMVRTEIRCAVCDSHLGHVFPDVSTRTGNRYCVNSVCLAFDKGEEGE